MIRLISAEKTIPVARGSVDLVLSYRQARIALWLHSIVKRPLNTDELEVITDDFEGIPINLNRLQDCFVGKKTGVLVTQEHVDQLSPVVQFPSSFPTFPPQSNDEPLIPKPNSA